VRFVIGKVEMGQVFSEYFSCCLSVWSHQWPTLISS